MVRVIVWDEGMETEDGKLRMRNPDVCVGVASPPSMV